MRAVDFGRAGDDYSQFRAGFPEAFFAQIEARGFIEPGMRLLDIGAGTGAIAREMARRGCFAYALDIAPELLRQAQLLDADASATTEYLVGRAEQLPTASAAFDVVSAGQCWHWFQGKRAAREVRRVLQPNGVIVIAHFDWLPRAGNVVAATEALIERYSPAWQLGGGNGFYPQWLDHLYEAGFARLETFSFDNVVPYSHEAWRGRIRASAGVGATLDDAQVQAFDDELSRVLQKTFPDDPLKVPHRVFAVIGKKTGIL